MGFYNRHGFRVIPRFGVYVSATPVRDAAQRLIRTGGPVRPAALLRPSVLWIPCAARSEE